jgi:asparagine synthase (glutamine-hydrolysing)
MCGIFGVFGGPAGRPVDREVLRKMSDSLAARGPDGGGIYTSASLGIGMRRLSIIDLDTGDQPLANEDRSIWVVFNGEIYNYRELTAALVERGHRFSTRSDTEVLVHLYEQDGEACVNRLRGMFAFALWDEPRRTLLLARDRLGIKPLYYSQTPEGVVFGSELKALTQSPWVSRQVDTRSLAAYLRYGYVPDPYSIFEGVHKVPPGCTIVIRDGRSSAPRRYWDLGEFYREGGTPVHEAEASDALWERLTESVRLHLVSDVPVGAFLSGGVDSSGILSIMVRHSREPVSTFSVGFREDRFNELPYARRVAEHFGTRHHELLVEPANLDVLECVLSAFDEPFADASAIPTFLVSRLAREHVKVVLSGDGGDELFAGYDRYLVDHRRRYASLVSRTGLARPLRALSTLLPEGTPGKNYAYNLSLPRMERYLDAISIFPPRVLRDTIDEEHLPAAEDPLKDLVEEGVGLDPLSRLQLIDFQTYLPGDILTKVDRMSMANSLEARVPFLDHSLVEFACRLPAELRLRSGELKYLLKKTLRGKLPDEVLTRPKQGFGVPLEAWFSKDLPNFFADILGNGTRLAALGVRTQAIRELVHLYRKRQREDHCRRLWALTVLERSLRNLDRQTAS